MSLLRIIQLSLIFRSVKGIRFNKSTISNQQNCSHCKNIRISLEDLLLEEEEKIISDVTYYK